MTYILPASGPAYRPGNKAMYCFSWWPTSCQLQDQCAVLATKQCTVPALGRNPAVESQANRARYYTTLFWTCYTALRTTWGLLCSRKTAVECTCQNILGLLCSRKTAVILHSTTPGGGEGALCNIEGKLSGIPVGRWLQNTPILHITKCTGHLSTQNTSREE